VVEARVLVEVSMAEIAVVAAPVGDPAVVEVRVLLLLVLLPTLLEAQTSGPPLSPWQASVTSPALLTPCAHNMSSVIIPLP
jgi:hypothetical protein